MLEGNLDCVGAGSRSGVRKGGGGQQEGTGELGAQASASRTNVDSGNYYPSPILLNYILTHTHVTSQVRPTPTSTVLPEPGSQPGAKMHWPGL